MYGVSFLRTDEAPLAGVKASGFLGFNATSFLLLHLGIFLHSSLQILSGPVMLDQTIRGHIGLMIDWDQVRFLAGPLQSFQSWVWLSLI